MPLGRRLETLDVLGQDVGDAICAAGAGTALVDVRTTDEYAVSHVDGATNVDIRSLAANADMIPTDSNVISYCGSGHRAGMSVPAMHVLGVATSKAYGGSYDSLVEAGATVAAS